MAKKPKLTKLPGTEDLKTIGTAIMRSSEPAFVLPAKPEHMVEAAKGVARTSDVSNAFLGALLTNLQDNEAHWGGQLGYETFEDFVEKEIGTTYSVAVSLIRGWKLATDLGLNPSTLNRISWRKLMLLTPAVRINIINNKNILNWLPLLEVGGSYELSSKDLREQIDQLVSQEHAIQDADAQEPDRARSLRLQIPSARMEAVRQHLSVIERGLAERGTPKHEVVASAFAMLAGQISSGNLEKNSAVTLNQVVDVVKTLAPEVDVLFVPKPGMRVNPKTLNAIPATKVFVAKIGGEFKHVVAIDADEAREFLGLGEAQELEEYPLIITNTYQAHVQTANPLVMDDDEPEIRGPRKIVTHVEPTDSEEDLHSAMEEDPFEESDDADTADTVEDEISPDEFRAYLGSLSEAQRTSVLKDMVRQALASVTSPKRDAYKQELQKNIEQIKKEVKVPVGSDQALEVAVALFMFMQGELETLGVDYELKSREELGA